MIGDYSFFCAPPPGIFCASADAHLTVTVLPTARVPLVTLVLDVLWMFHRSGPDVRLIRALVNVVTVPVTVTVCPNAAFAANNAATVTAAKFMIFMRPIQRPIRSYEQAFC